MYIKSKIILFILSVFMFFSSLYSQSYKEDSLAVRAILDSNDLHGIRVDDVSTKENDRIVVLYLEADMVINIKFLPADAGKLTALRNLTLIKFPYLTNLPPEIGNLKSLDTLIIQECGLTELPEEIGNCSSLTYLFLDCPVSELPSEIGNISSLKSFECYCNLDSLPSSIGNLSSLEKLNISLNNKLTSLPIEIGNLSSLKYLCLSLNNLQSLPDEIGNISNLESLLMQHNSIPEIPSSIGNLSKLKVLDIYRNHLTGLPPESGKLRSLTSFKARNNNISFIPEDFCSLSSLIDLNLQENKLTALPDNFGNLISLGKANLSKNMLQTISASITSLNLPQGPSGINLCFNPDLVFTEDQQVWADAVDYAEYEQKYCDTKIGENFSKAVKNNPALLSFSRNAVRYTVQNPGHVLLEVFNVKGKNVKILFNGYKNTGVYTVKYNVENSGVYLIKLKIGNDVVVSKNLIVQ